ncbi:RagB/SusD family nutrient uptake outer membrane protein [uncultured Duncaniella sp.]|uniref:RagB/SusD family nutrient uptake outer membrane protein n=1 Tax=uncultured Duncaniella sp. TaxID=2768039 RepID=UPI0025D67A49|nr:RagB/SusD family nutrient uptake outer membrane protein [uncultured Duncaniella sp.]
MKNRYIIGGLAVALMTPALVSCGDDFLNEEPITNISSVTVNTSEEGANAAVTGLVRQMQRQFDDLKNGNLNASGETFFANIYGEALGPDNNVGEATNYMRTGIKPANFRYAIGWWPSWMYKYCYSIIGSANSILTNLSEDPTNDNELWLKASALTMRAHAYTRLMQVYAPRWIDSNNGEKHCIVLRIKSGEPNEKQFSTCNEVYDQLYRDLNDAIAYFEKSSKKRGNQLFFVDENVARGIYARLALLKDDYKTAQKMAHDARQDYTIMSEKDYLSGFSTENDEWMWAPAMDPLGIYYWGFGAHYACNGHYVKSWGYTSSMQYSLYKHFSETDVRSQLYFGPLCVKHAPEIAAKYGVTEEDFFNPNNYSNQTYGISITGSGSSPKGKNKAMWDFIKEYGKRFASLRPEDIKGIYPTNSKGLSIGIQYKFQGLPDGYTSCWPPYMRAGEMLLIEAEAAYHNSDYSTTVSCLTELMAKRDPNYTIPATSGEALLDEVKLQRRLELWGEGFNWFDYKRWNEVIEYKAFDKDNIENMGSYPTTVAATYQPDFMNGWRAAIPQAEFTYNKMADPTLVGQ